MKFNSLLSAINIVILCAALVCLNYLAAQINVKLDLTQDRLYTLSEGSHTIADQVEDDALIQYFFSRSEETLPLMIKDYGRRVQELLTQFAELSPRLSLEVYDPRPDSDEEEMATRCGIHGAKTTDSAALLTISRARSLVASVVNRINLCIISGLSLVVKIQSSNPIRRAASRMGPSTAVREAQSGASSLIRPHEFFKNSRP